MNVLISRASLLVLGLVVTALAGSVVMASGTPVTAGSAIFSPSAGGPPAGTHGACVVSAVRAFQQSANPADGIGALVRGMARRC